jgi:hypothetical protein
VHKNSELTLEYLILHVLRTGDAHNIRSDRESHLLSIDWKNGESIHYTPEIWQNLPSFKRFIQAQKIWIRISAN